MPKYYVHRTQACYITDIDEVEAANEDEAIEKANDGDGVFVGLSIGDYLDGSDCDDRVTPASPEHITEPFFPKPFPKTPP